MFGAKKTARIMLLTLVLLLGLAQPGQAAEDRKLRIVASVFPQYDWLRNILGERLDEVELTLLQDSGVDLHNFQPSARDIMKVSSAELFVYIGGISDNWVENAVSQAVNKDIVAVNLIKALGDAVKKDISIEGMQDITRAHNDEGPDNEHEHDHEHENTAHIHDHDDEHIWLSLRNAQVLSQLLADRLSQLDPDYAAVYQTNAAAYIRELQALDSEFQSAADKAAQKTLLFADRFPFRYMMDDYGLLYFAAFAGCSAETEASFDTITFLSGKVDELELKHVLVLEGADKALASTVIDNTETKGQTMIVFNSMQSVDQAALAQGASYLGIMKENLQALIAALN